MSNDGYSFLSVHVAMPVPCNLLCRVLTPEIGARLQRCRDWVYDLSSYCVSCIYPGANYQRHYMAVKMLQVMLEILCSCSTDGSPVNAPGQAFFSPVVTHAGTVHLLLGEVLA